MERILDSTSSSATVSRNAEEEEEGGVAVPGMDEEDGVEGLVLRGWPPAIQTWVTHLVLSGL